jgi:D-lyxose ketol-isomerase
MKKTEVDRARAESLAMLSDAGIKLGPGEQIEITDFGKGEYDKLGLGLIIRLNEPEYASKWLTVSPGQVCPNHFHKIIKETFLIIKGEVKMNLNGEEHLMKPGDKCTFGPGTRHTFTSEKGAVIEEITTRQVATDNYFDDKSIERYVKVEEE